MRILVDAQKVKQSKYLGSVITEDGHCDRDIRSRIAIGKAAFMDRKSLVTSKMDLELRKRIMKSTMRRVALYGSETWTMTKE